MATAIRSIASALVLLFATFTSTIAQSVDSWGAELHAQAVYDDIYWHNIPMAAPAMGTNGSVNCLFTTYYGALIAAGDFSIVDGASASYLAFMQDWEWHSWSYLNINTDGPIFDLIQYGGDIVIAGEFSTASGKPVNGIARWDSYYQEWFPLGSGMNGPVLALAEYSGELIAGGDFTTADGISANGIAKYNGTNWSPLGSGVSGGSGAIRALKVSNGALIAGGEFISAGGNGASCIARWDGTQWSSLGIGVNAPVEAIVENDGSLYVGGWFTSAGGYPAGRVASWDGSSWHSMSDGMTNGIYSLGVYEGEIVAGGAFTVADNQGCSHIARWDGVSWQPMGNGTDGVVRSLLAFNGELLVGGEFLHAGNVGASHLALWDGDEWKQLKAGVKGVIRESIVYDGSLYVGGRFNGIGGVDAENVACFNGSTWQSVGDGLNGTVEALAIYNNQLVVGGCFTSAGGIPGINFIASWDGSNWHALGTGMDYWVHDLVVYNGDLIAGGYFSDADGSGARYIARWDGSNWYDLGATGGTASSYEGVEALAVHNGELIAGGLLSAVPGFLSNYIAHWDGAAWHSLDSGVNGKVRSLISWGGDLIVAGDFLGVKNWNGSVWSELGNSPDMGALTFTIYNDELIAGGHSSSGNIAAWDGNSWSSLGSGVNDYVFTLCGYNGDLLVGGGFSTAGCITASCLALWDRPSVNSVGIAQYDFIRNRLTDLHIDLFDGFDIPVVGDYMDFGPTDVLVNNAIRSGNPSQEEIEAFSRLLMSVKLVNASYRYVPDNTSPLSESDEVSGAEELWDLGMKNSVRTVLAATVIGRLFDDALKAISNFPGADKIVGWLADRVAKLAVDSFAEIREYIPDEDSKRTFDAAIPILKYSLPQLITENPCMACVIIDPVSRGVLDEAIITLKWIPDTQPAVNQAGIRASSQDYLNTIAEAEAAFQSEWSNLKNSTDQDIAVVQDYEALADLGGATEILQELWDARKDGPIAVLKQIARAIDALIGVSKTIWSSQAAGHAIAYANAVPDRVVRGVDRIYGYYPAPLTHPGSDSPAGYFSLSTPRQFAQSPPDQFGRLSEKFDTISSALLSGDSLLIHSTSDDILYLIDSLSILFDDLCLQIEARKDSARYYFPDAESLLTMADSSSHRFNQRLVQCSFMISTLQLDFEDSEYNSFVTSSISNIPSELQEDWGTVESVLSALFVLSPSAYLQLISSESFLESGTDTTLFADFYVKNSSGVPVDDVTVIAFENTDISVAGSDTITVGSLLPGDSAHMEFVISIGSFMKAIARTQTVHFDLAAHGLNAVSGYLSQPIVVTTDYCCGRYTGGYTGNTDCDTGGKMGLADVTRLIDRVYLSKTALCCEANGNVDGDVDAKLNLGDITGLIDHIYLSKEPTALCP